MRYLLLLLPAVLLLSLSDKYFITVDSAYLSFYNSEIFSTFPLVNFNSNAYCQWRFDPIVHLVTKHLNYKSYLCLSTIIFSFGLLFLVSKFETEIKRESNIKFYLIALFNLTIFLFFGFDLSLISSITWLPWLALFIMYYEKNKNLPNYLTLIFLTVLFTLTANHYSLIIMLGLITHLYILDYFKFKNLTTSSLWVILIIPSILTFTLEAPRFPNYDYNAHLVANYGVIDGLQPLVGTMPKFPVIDREFVRSAYANTSVFILLLLAIVTLAHYLKRILIFTKIQWSLLAMSFVLTILVLLDSNLIYSSYSQIMPLQSISRLLPGLFFIPITSIMLLLSLILMILLLSLIENTIFSLTLFVITILLSGVSSFASNSNVPFLSKKNFNKPWKELEQVQQVNKNEIIKILNSPSYSLIRENSLNVIIDPDRHSLVYRPACEFDVDFNASSNQDNLKNLCDGKDTSRWSSKLGKQTGEEWIKIYFSELTQIKAVRLTTGKYYTDFPRGIAIEISEDCSKSENDTSIFKRVVTDKKTEGEIKYTNDGYPFYSTQYTYSAYLGSSINVKCLLIRQISKDENFEWSVADIELSN